MPCLSYYCYSNHYTTMPRVYLSLSPSLCCYCNSSVAAETVAAAADCKTPRFIIDRDTFNCSKPIAQTWFSSSFCSSLRSPLPSSFARRPIALLCRTTRVRLNQVDAPNHLSLLEMWKTSDTAVIYTMLATRPVAWTEPIATRNIVSHWTTRS